MIDGQTKKRKKHVARKRRSLPITAGQHNFGNRSKKKKKKKKKTNKKRNILSDDSVHNSDDLHKNVK